MLLCVYPRLLLAAAHAGLGPGRGAWRVDTAENHGLDGAALKIAADLTAQFAPTRNCLVVVKDGVLIAEEYFNGATSDSIYETDSLGKTAVAPLFGVASQKGLLDIDRPMSKFMSPAGAADSSGDGPKFEAGHSWGTFWPYATVRTVLAQSSGYGEVMPGTSFTYDSDDFIQHLSYALSAVVPNNSALAFARDEYAVPLGVPEFFDYDGIGAEQVCMCNRQDNIMHSHVLYSGNRTRTGWAAADRRRWRPDGAQPSHYVCARRMYAETLAHQPFNMTTLAVPCVYGCSW